MNQSLSALRCLPAALAVAALAPCAFAGEFTVSLRGHISAVNGVLPAPFAGVALGDDVLVSVSILDQPTFSTGQTTYPVDGARSTLTIGGTVQPFLIAQPNGVLNILDDLAFGADRISVTASPWVGGFALMRIDDPTSSQFNALNLAHMLGLDMGPLDPGNCFMQLISSPGFVTVGFDEIRIGDGANVVPTAAGDGTGAACPCGNVGGLGQGCANSTGAGGTLTAFGSASLTDDDLGFWADHLPASTSAILFSGTSAANGVLGVPFGAGLRGPAGQLQRLGIEVADSHGRAEWAVGVLGRSAALVGTTHHVQAWYRDTASPCAGTTFNSTQAFAVTVQP